jgi:hypothetical protein
MVVMNVDADLAQVRQPIPLTPFSCQDIETLFTQSNLLKAKGVEFIQVEQRTWIIKYKETTYEVTFYPNIFDELPSLRLMSFGEPLFENLLTSLIKPHNNIF